MKSIIIRLLAGLLLMAVGLFLFIDTCDIYPFKGYHVYECSLCGYQWNEMTLLPEGKTKTCPNYGVVNPETNKREGACREKLCVEGAEESVAKKAAGNFLYAGNVTDKLVTNTIGGVLAIGGFGLIVITGYRFLLNRPSKKDED